MHWEQIIGRGILALVLIAVIYFIWPYIVGFLAVVGAFQIYRVWRHYTGRGGDQSGGAAGEADRGAASFFAIRCRI